MGSQRNSRSNRPGGERPNSHGRRPSGKGRRGPRFTEARLVAGGLCILAALVLVYRSVLAGVIREGAGIGLLGLIPAVLFFMAGFMAIQMRHRVAPLAFLIPALLCLVADITCLIHASKGMEWKVWGICAAAACVVFLVFLCLHRQRGLLVPAVLLLVTVIMTAAVCILAGKSSSSEGDSEQAAGTDEQTDDSTLADGTGDSQTAADTAQTTSTGTLNLVTDTFTLKYVRNEVGTDVNGDTCVYVYYDFTNNSEDAVSIPSVSYTKLTQNGTECGKASVSEMNDEMNNYKTEVEPGTTVTACEVYSISDTSDVVLEAVEFVPTNAKSASQTLTLGQTSQTTGDSGDSESSEESEDFEEMSSESAEE